MNTQEARVRLQRLQEEKKRRDAMASLKEFIIQAWPIVEKGVEFSDNWHLDAICEHLEAVTRFDIKQLMINIPPRHMKSTIVAVMWPAWVWTNHPEKKFLFSSYNPALSMRDAEKTRQLVKSPWYQKRWPLKFHPKQDEKGYYINLKGGHRISTSPGGAGTGQGGDYIVFDDPHKVKNVESEVQRKAVHHYWDNEMSTRGNNPEFHAHVMIGQRTHEDDLFGHVDGYEKLVLPAEFEPKNQETETSLGFKDPRSEDGELLWPHHFTPEALAKITKGMDNYQVAGQMQQRPVPKEGVTFLEKYFSRRWNRLPDEFDYIINCWDLTFDDEGARVANNAGYALGLLGADIYVMNEICDKMDFDAQEANIKLLRKGSRGCKEVLIENAANGKAQAKRLRKLIPGIQLVTPVGSKEDRARAQLYLWKSGNVIWPEDDLFPWVEDAIGEIKSFGPKARYKDRVDAITHGLEFLGKKMEEMMDDEVMPVSFERPSNW